MDFVITIIAHGSDKVAERDHILPTGTTSLITDVLVDAGLEVDDISVDFPDLVDEDA